MKTTAQERLGGSIVYEHEAPRFPAVPMQRDAPPLHVPHALNIQRANPAPATAARDGHHDWGAVVAVLAAVLTLAALLSSGPTVTDADHATPQRESTISTR